MKKEMSNSNIKEDEQKEKTKNNSGITLVALVITIIVLLILAGVSIATLMGEGGIFSKAEAAKAKHEQASEEEKNNLDKLYGSIKIATDDDAEITISMKDLKKFINEQRGIEGIHEGSVLMSSVNSSLEVETVNLSSFTNTFNEKFVEYFKYDETTGELNCIKDGEYIVKLGMETSGDIKAWSDMRLSCFINNIDVSYVMGTVTPKVDYARDNNSVRIFLKVGDKLAFSKKTQNEKLPFRNNAIIQLIKM